MLLYDETVYQVKVTVELIAKVSYASNEGAEDAVKRIFALFLFGKALSFCPRHKIGVKQQ